MSGRNNKSNDYYLVRSETVSIKAPPTFPEVERLDAAFKLEDYFDRVFETAFEQIKIAYPDFQCFRNGVK